MSNYSLNNAVCFSLRTLLPKNQNDRSSQEGFYFLFLSPAESSADRLKLRLYESQLSSMTRVPAVKEVDSVINRDRSSQRAQPAHYTPLCVHGQIRHNEAQLLHIRSHVTMWCFHRTHTHIHTHERMIFTVNGDAGLWLVIFV